METFFGVLVPISLFIGGFITIVFLRKYQNDERMAMIEKGMEPSQRKKGNGFGTLRFALLTIGVGLGILIGFIIIRIMATNDESVTGAVYGSTVLIFGGGGLLSAYLANKKREDKENQL
ncbi:MAG: DUF6249 domain-containing protein [Bacteroidota bacterium]